MCTLYLVYGYWQQEVDIKDREKTAFASHRGLFQLRVPPFGLTNAPSCFERLMELILRGFQWENCLCYLDDIIVFGKTFDETLQNLKLVFDRLRETNLILKPKNCFLFQTEVIFLGHIVSEKGISCNPDKIKCVLNWPIPTNISEIKSFFGFSRVLQTFIDNFSDIASPLKKLTGKNVKFVWIEECQKAF